jgi:hypothetical protein
MQGLSTEDLQLKAVKEAEPEMASNVEALSSDPSLGETANEGDQPEEPPMASPADVAKALEAPTDQKTVALLPKLLRTTKLYFASKSFFFSYEYDLSRRLDKQLPLASSQPLFQQFDPLVRGSIEIPLCVRPLT